MDSGGGLFSIDFEPVPVVDGTTLFLRGGGSSGASSSDAVSTGSGCMRLGGDETRGFWRAGILA